MKRIKILAIKRPSIFIDKETTKDTGILIINNNKRPAL